MQKFSICLAVFIFSSLSAESSSETMKNGCSDGTSLLGQASELRPCIISRTPPSTGAGFWSNFLVILAGIDQADKRGWIPVVDMENNQTLYNESTRVLNTMNAWEYFFEQPGGMTLDQVIGPHAMYNGGGNGRVFSRAYTVQPKEKDVRRAKELITKYIKVKKYILDEVDGYIEPGIHENILGVHVRGTDRRQGTDHHFLTSSVDVYLEEAKKLNEIYQFSQIYLACDELETVEMFKQVFSDRLIVTKAYRVSALTNLDDPLKSWLHEAARPLHKYNLGREVLIDTLLLARCGHLLIGPSNVSHVAIYFAEGVPMIHEVASPGMFNAKLPKK